MARPSTTRRALTTPTSRRAVDGELSASGQPDDHRRRCNPWMWPGTPCSAHGGHAPESRGVLHKRFCTVVQSMAQAQIRHTARCVAARRASSRHAQRHLNEPTTRCEITPPLLGETPSPLAQRARTRDVPRDTRDRRTQRDTRRVLFCESVRVILHTRTRPASDTAPHTCLHAPGAARPAPVSAYTHPMPCPIRTTWLVRLRRRITRRRMNAKAHVDVVAILDLQLRGRLRLVDAHCAKPEHGRPDVGHLPDADGAHELSQRH